MALVAQVSILFTYMMQDLLNPITVHYVHTLIMHAPQVYLLFCATIPHPARLHFVLANMAHRSEGKPVYKVQGDMVSTITEAMFRIWLAVLLVRGEEMTDKQWW